MVPRISASSCDGTRPSIPSWWRGWVGCGTDLSYTGVRVLFDSSPLRRRPKIVSRHRDARYLLSDGPFNGSHHCDLIGGHEGVGVARRSGSPSAPDAVDVILGLLRDIVV